MESGAHRASPSMPPMSGALTMHRASAMLLHCWPADYTAAKSVLTREWSGFQTDALCVMLFAAQNNNPLL